MIKNTEEELNLIKKELNDNHKKLSIMLNASNLMCILLAMFLVSTQESLKESMSIILGVVAFSAVSEIVILNFVLKSLGKNTLILKELSAKGDKYLVCCSPLTEDAKINLVVDRGDLLLLAKFPSSLYLSNEEKYKDQLNEYASNKLIGRTIYFGKNNQEKIKNIIG